MSDLTESNGQRKSSSKRRFGCSFFSLFLLLIFLGILSGGVYAFQKIAHATPWLPSFYEKVSPEITWVDEISGIGSDLVTGKIKVSDSGGGLDEGVVRLSQRNQPITLLKKRFEGRAPTTEEFEIVIDPKIRILSEGKADLEIVAFDRTLWSNAVKETVSLAVDFNKPRIEVITLQQNAVEGGVELVFFKIVGKPPVQQGIEDVNTLYPAFRAKNLDPSFKSYEDIYFALFPLKIGESKESNKLHIRVRDQIGNIAMSPFNYSIRSRRFAQPKTNLDEASSVNLTKTVSELLSKNDLSLSSAVSAAKTHDEGVLSELWSKSEAALMWKGSFGRPLNSMPTSSFGENRSYFLGNEEFSNGSATGIRFSSASKQVVRATNNGKVVFSAGLLSYGKTVVIDHGFGLFTLYAHLGERSRSVGDAVSLGDPIGETGRTGFALGNEVWFETRLHGIPVSPNEWWDSTWVSDHIDKKISFVQSALIGNPGE